MGYETGGACRRIAQEIQGGSSDNLMHCGVFEESRLETSNKSNGQQEQQAGGAGETLIGSPFLSYCFTNERDFEHANGQRVSIGYIVTATQ